MPGALFVNNDVLFYGPLPPLTSPSEWQRVREAYLSTLEYLDDGPFSFAGQGVLDVLTNAHMLRDAARITAWIGISSRR